MILPKFTTRKMLLWVVGCALFFTVVSFGASGSAWAVAFALSAIGLTFAFFSFGLLYTVISFLQMAFSRSKGHRRMIGESPFAETRRPPQLLRPDEPDSN